MKEPELTEIEHLKNLLDVMEAKVIEKQELEMMLKFENLALMTKIDDLNTQILERDKLDFFNKADKALLKQW